MDPDGQLRNLRDFLMVYNRMTEICFQRCTSNFNYRNLTMDEERCLDSCAGKLIRSNHRLMGTYVQLMPRMVQRRMEEMESKAKAAEAAASVSTEAAPGPITTTSASPQLLTPVATDVGPEPHSSVLKPAELEIPVGIDAAATGVHLSAATPLTPATETLNTPVLNKAGDGPSYSTGFVQPPESGSSAPVFAPSNPTSLSEDVGACQAKVEPQRFPLCQASSEAQSGSVSAGRTVVSPKHNDEMNS